MLAKQHGARGASTRFAKGQGEALQKGFERGGSTLEPVPHLHEDDKNRLSSTEQMTFEDFIKYLKKSVNPDR